MSDFFQEVKYIYDYFKLKGEPAIVHVFSSDGRGIEDFSRNFSARFAVSMPRNSPLDLIDIYGLPNLYYAWGKFVSKELDKINDLNQRASRFEAWLRDTPEEEVKEHLPVKRIPLEEMARSH